MGSGEIVGRELMHIKKKNYLLAIHKYVTLFLND